MVRVEVRIKISAFGWGRNWVDVGVGVGVRLRGLVYNGTAHNCRSMLALSRSQERTDLSSATRLSR